MNRYFLLFLAASNMLLTFYSSVSAEEKPSPPPIAPVPNEMVKHQGPGYSITLPANWTPITDVEQIKQRVLWQFVNCNGTVWGECPTFLAWDGPGSTDSFLTIMKVKHDASSFGTSQMFDEIHQWLSGCGMKFQERGTTTVNGKRARWWIHSMGNGMLFQQCYMLTNERYLYILCFTTTSVPEEKQKLFQQYANSLCFETQ